MAGKDSLLAGECKARSALQSAALALRAHAAEAEKAAAQLTEQLESVERERGVLAAAEGANRRGAALLRGQAAAAEAAIAGERERADAARAEADVARGHQAVRCSLQHTADCAAVPCASTIRDTRVCRRQRSVSDTSRQR